MDAKGNQFDLAEIGGMKKRKMTAETAAKFDALAEALRGVSPERLEGLLRRTRR